MALNETHQLHRHKRRHPGVYILGVILILLFAGIAWIGITGSGPPKLTSGTTAILGAGSVASYTLQNNSKDFAVYLHNSSGASAGIDIAMYPVLANPTVILYATTGGAYNISTFGQGNANINIKVISSNATSAKVELTPIPVGLDLAVSSGITVLQPSPIPTGSQQPITTISGSQATTTIETVTTIISSAEGSSSTTTTVAPTTTVGVNSSIYTMVNASYIGAVMVGLNKLYIAGQSCTPPLYNQTMLLKGQSTSPPLNFANVTLYTPQYLTLTATAVASGYLASYDITAPSKEASGVALTFEISQYGAINTSSITFKGPWAGENYSELDNGYQVQSTVNNACADYIS